MDQTHFGLRQQPFRATPDTDLYYPATTHEVALAELRRSLDDEQGFAILSGESGTGKTLTIHRLLELLGETCRAAFLTNTHWSNCSDLLQAILFDLSLPYQGRTEQELRLAVTESCLEQFKQGGKTVIVIDEAQHLTADHLEELRLLANLESKHGKAVQVILAGMPELRQNLEYPSASSFRQRIAVQVMLEPLSPEESVDYLMHQVRVAGGRPERLFSEEAPALIAGAAKGLPRLLNQVAAGAMHLTAQTKGTQIDAEAALEAISRLGLQTDEPHSALAASNDALNSSAVEEEAVTTVPPPPTVPLNPDRPPVVIFDGADAEAQDTPAESRSRKRRVNRAG